jgi:hypothetical protein
MPAVLLIGALFLGGRIYLRHRRARQSGRRGVREAVERWDDEGGALPVTDSPRT